MPVLPPIAASTWARSVVGTCTSGRPRSSVAAAKPARSPTTPPPSATTGVRRAIPAQRPDAGQAIAVVAGEQRTARDVPHPAGDLLGRRGEADDRTRTDQPAAVVRIEQRPASRGDDRVGNGACFLDRVALEPPEVCLPVTREDLRDGAARGG